MPKHNAHKLIAKKKKEKKKAVNDVGGHFKLPLKGFGRDVQHSQENSENI